MKKLSLIIIISILFILQGCDKVTNVIDKGTVRAAGTRNVLVEDYTGHKCGNCPAAAVQLTSLETQYPGRVIPLAVHAGYFAKTNAQYPTDFQTSDGNAYDLLFGNGAAGNPNGLVNRTGWGTASFIEQWTSWASQVASEMAKQAVFNIRINPVFNTSTRQLNTNITVKSLTANSGTYKLVVLLTEDSLVAEQLDYRQPIGQQTIPNYIFNHVLRGAVNSTWGDAIFINTAAKNDSVVKSYTNFTVNTGYRANKCHIVAYVYDADVSSTTHYQVLEANEALLK